ncbi:peptidylprolyl isomerase [Pseudoteredinibacter isoporae]|nr:peptidylprolyl isomerase [Pseudoteredinibacter isoporae]NHO85845.1 peptidylprolyl isomerase [Pseudoteredinibacter isoporae]NIB25703.1 peptidylprolyl isomerase [Pseudoteredinibacter isoporae]
MQTGLGELIFELYPNKAPKTVANFLRYVESKRFNGSDFFRIVTEAHPQTEDPVKIETIQGGLNIDHPNLLESIGHEPTTETGLHHRRGSLSMARYQVGSANGSFFICFRDEPALDFAGARQPDGQGFAVFGQLVDGYPVLDALYARAERDEYLTTPIAIEQVSVLHAP